MEATKENKLLTVNKLKIIAASFMFFDHFVSVFFPHNELISLVFRLFGRAAAPVFCFLIAEGFFYTSNLKKYIFRLFILAIISHLPYNLAFGLSLLKSTSVIWPLTMGLVALAAIKSEKTHFILKMMVLAACCALSYTANWSFFAVLWIVLFGLFHGNLIRQIAGFCIVGTVYLLWNFNLIPFINRPGFFHEQFPQWFQLGIFLAIPLLAMYNGKPGKKSKFMTWFFYVFYPAHLILLILPKQFTPLAEILDKLF